MALKTVGSHCLVLQLLIVHWNMWVNNIIVSVPSMILMKSTFYWKNFCYIFDVKRSTYMMMWLQPRGTDVVFFYTPRICSGSSLLSERYGGGSGWVWNWPVDLNLMPRWRMHGTIPPLHHTSSWCAAQLSIGTVLVVPNTYFYALYF
jgi:hypothetical protein